MSASRLCLNASKTQVLWLGSRHNIDRLTVHEVPVLSSTVGVVGSARDLGVVIYSRLSMAAHVASVCHSAYYHLRQIRPTLQSLSRDATKTRHTSSAVTWTIATRCCTASPTTYFNDCSLYRLITWTGRREHISPVLQ